MRACEQFSIGRDEASGLTAGLPLRSSGMVGSLIFADRPNKIAAAPDEVLSAQGELSDAVAQASG